MAHLLVTNETIVDLHQQENSRSIGKHKRDVGLTCFEGSFWPNSDATKRQALASITNQPDLLSVEIGSSRVFGSTVQKKATARAVKPNKSNSSKFGLDSSSFLVCEEVGLKPIGSEKSSSRHDSRMSMSGAMSSSFRSMESSFSFDSPMHISSPDLFSSKLKSKAFVDIDLAEDANCGANEYAAEIFAYLKEAEVRFHANPQYMQKQPDITEGMRCILVDWLVEVAEEFKLDQQTLYMALSIVDRFLSNMSVMRSKLQLVGGAAMYIASKFEEIFPPEIADFTYITDDTYTKTQIVCMERLILKVLDFNLAAPTTHTFLLRYLKASEADLQPSKFNPGMASFPSCNESNSQIISSLSMYLCELALQDADPYLKYYPSVVAASAVCLARHTLGEVAWPTTLEYYSDYSVFDIGNCVQDLHRTMALAPQHAQQAIKHKYSSHIFHAISSIKAPETLPC